MTGNGNHTTKMVRTGGWFILVLTTLVGIDSKKITAGTDSIYFLFPSNTDRSQRQHDDKI